MMPQAEHSVGRLLYDDIKISPELFVLGYEWTICKHHHVTHFDWSPCGLQINNDDIEN